MVKMKFSNKARTRQHLLSSGYRQIKSIDEMIDFDKKLIKNAKYSRKKLKTKRYKEILGNTEKHKKHCDRIIKESETDLREMKKARKTATKNLKKFKEKSKKIWR